VNSGTAAAWTAAGIAMAAALVASWQARLASKQALSAERQAKAAEEQSGLLRTQMFDEARERRLASLADQRRAAAELLRAMQIWQATAESYLEGGTGDSSRRNAYHHSVGEVTYALVGAIARPRQRRFADAVEQVYATFYAAQWYVEAIREVPRAERRQALADARAGLAAAGKMCASLMHQLTNDLELPEQQEDNLLLPK